MPGTMRFPPRGVALWDYGYPLTAHKARGLEGDDVVLLEQPVVGSRDDRRRWLYTRDYPRPADAGDHRQVSTRDGLARLKDVFVRRRR